MCGSCRNCAILGWISSFFFIGFFIWIASDSISDIHLLVFLSLSCCSRGSAGVCAGGLFALSRCGSVGVDVGVCVEGCTVLAVWTGGCNDEQKKITHTHHTQNRTNKHHKHHACHTYFSSYFFCLFFFLGFLSSQGHLKETIVVQLISFTCLFVLLAQFYGEFFRRGFSNAVNVPIIGNDISQLAGVVLFNFAFSVTVPAWLCEKKKEVSVNNVCDFFAQFFLSGYCVSCCCCSCCYF